MRSNVYVLCGQEGDFSMSPTSKEDAQRLWQTEKMRLQDTLRRQKEQMQEDGAWLEKEEKLLVTQALLLFSFLILFFCLARSEGGKNTVE